MVVLMSDVCVRLCAELERKSVLFPDGQTATISVCPKCKVESWTHEDRYRWQRLNIKHDEENPPQYKWSGEQPTTIIESVTSKIPTVCAKCNTDFMIERFRFLEAVDKESLTCSNECRVALLNQRSHEYKLRSLARAQRVQSARRRNKNR